MSNELVSDSDVGKALDYLRDSAGPIGDATRQARFTEHLLKHLLALEMKKHEGSAAAQEREARASEVYKQAMMEDAVAAGELAKMKALREAAAMKLEIWRTQSSNFRSMKL
jgi:hypothetical protein